MCDGLIINWPMLPEGFSRGGCSLPASSAMNIPAAVEFEGGLEIGGSDWRLRMRAACIFGGPIRSDELFSPG